MNTILIFNELSVVKIITHFLTSPKHFTYLEAKDVQTKMFEEKKLLL